MDGISPDVVVEYRDAAGLGLLGIETKLTEPLSNGGDLLDSARNYRPLCDHPASPFNGPMSGELVAHLTKETLVQWTRNYLLTLGLQQMGSYASHSYWTVFPRSHADASDAAKKYPTILREPSRTFAAFTLEDILAAWTPLLSSPNEEEWLKLFPGRYLDLGESDSLWKALGGHPDG